MSLTQYLYFGYFGAAVFAIAGLIWIDGAITRRSGLRFICDVFMVLSLFVMLIGFGGRAKQERLIAHRKARISRLKNNYHKNEKKFLSANKEATLQADQASSTIKKGWKTTLDKQVQLFNAYKKKRTKKNHQAWKNYDVGKKVSRTIEKQNNKFQTAKKYFDQEEDYLIKLRKYDNKYVKYRFKTYYRINKLSADYLSTAEKCDGLSYQEYCNNVQKAKQKLENALKHKKS